MPPLTLHMAVARDVADRLRIASIDKERGNLYMGSTVPDVRAITHWEREQTHFFDVNNFEEQSSVAEFLRAYPDLAEAKRLQRPAQAFVAGYLTHLVMDETWINAIYRPYFGERSPLGGDLRAKVMDRALQFAMDSERRSEQDLMAHISAEVMRADLEIDVGVVDRDTLRRWYDIVAEAVSGPADWERFRRAVRRHIGDTGDREEAFQEMMRALPDMVDETVRYLTPERMRWFMEESTVRSLQTVKEYVDCA